jgi:hypothetical protein
MGFHHGFLDGTKISQLGQSDFPHHPRLTVRLTI